MSKLNFSSVFLLKSVFFVHCCNTIDLTCMLATKFLIGTTVKGKNEFFEEKIVGMKITNLKLVRMMKTQIVVSSGENSAKQL